MRNLLRLMQRSKTCIHGFAVDRRIIQKWLFTGILLVFVMAKGKTQTYTPVTVTGFNADVIADGATFAIGTTVTADVDGSGYYFLNQSFTAFGTPTYYLPTSGLINSVATTGLSFQLASASANNSLKLASPNVTGALTFSTSQSASTIYILATSGGGPSTVDITVKFTDSTTQLFSGQGISDWYGGSGYAIQGIGRVNGNGLVLDNGGGTTDPRLYQLALALNGSNYNKQVAYISFTQTNPTGAGFPQIMAINGSFTAATSSPTGYLVVRYPNGATPVAPVNGTIYTAGNTLGTGTVLSVGTATNFSATGLSAPASYTFYVYAYNNTNCGGPVYNTTTPLSGTQATNSCSGPSGTITVGPSGTYSTLTAALAVVSGGVSGPVTLELQSNYTSSSEVFPITFGSNACITSTNRVTIRPATGANGLVITGSNAGPTIDFSGSSYVTIDGRPGGVGSSITVTSSGTTNTTNLNIINTNTAGSAIRLDNQSSYNKITYCDVQAQNTTGANVPASLAGVIYFGNNGANGNDYNTIDHCNIHAAGTGTNVPSIGIYALGAANNGASVTFNDKDTITNNNIYDFFLASGNSVGIELNQGVDSWTIANNSIFQASTLTFTAGGYNRGIWIIPNRNTGSVGNGFIITGNYIGGSAPSATGTPYTLTAQANYFEGIRLEIADGSSANPSSVQGNTITNLSQTTTMTTANDPFHGIALNGCYGSVNVGTVTGSGAHSIGLFIASTSSSYTPAFNLVNNIVGGISLPGAGSNFSVNSIYASSTSTTASFVKGVNIASGYPVVTITGNTIANLSNASLATGSTVCQVVGIAISGTSSSSTIQSPAINYNTIKNLYNASAVTGTGASASTMGISMNATSTVITNISNNIIDSLVTSGNAAVMVTGFFDAPGGSSSAVLLGILVNAGTTTVANNMIRLGIKADGTSVTAPLTIYGIWAATTFANNFYHNSVGTTATNTFAFNRFATSGTYDIRDNIFANVRSNATTGGKHYTTYFTTSNTGATVNYNVYQYSGTGGVFAYSGTADVSSYTTGWVVTDGNSLVGDPQFISPAGTATTVNLHISPSSATWAEGAGTLIASVTDDYDGQTRSGLTPVDIGADAGNFTAYATCVAPNAPTALVLTAAPLQINGSFTAASGGATGYLVVRYLASATITAPTNANSYAVGASLGAGTVVAAGAATNFNSTGLAASSSYTYYHWIIRHKVNYYVQQRYDCLSGGIGGPVVLELQSNYTSTSETFPITLSNNACVTSTNKITIRPATGANGLVITGSNAGPTVDFSGSSYVTIDGRPGGVGAAITVTTAGTVNAANLNIINTNTAGVAVRLDNQATGNTIKYCDLQGQNTAAANVPTTLAGVVYFGNNGANGNDSNTVDHCNIHSSGSGTTTPSIGIYSLGYDNQGSTAAYIAQFNDNDTITNNNIYDFYSSANSVGIEANYGNTGWNISGNSFFQTSAITVSSSATSYNRAIWLIPYRGNYAGEVGNGFAITGNYIGGTLPACGGTPYTFSSGTTGYFEGIRLELADAATAQAATSVQGNTITNISITSSTSSDAMHGINITSGKGNVNVGTITGNTIGTATGTTGATSGGITIAASGAVPSHMILVGGTYTINVKNNVVGNVLLTAAGSYFSGIFTNTAVTGNFSNNTITNITASSTGTTSGRYINGIQVVGINIASTTAIMSGGITGASSAIIGIYAASTNAAGCTVSQNTIDSLVHLAGANTSAILTGIYVAAGTSTFANNMVRLGINPDGTNLTTALTLNGIISVTTAANNFYYNSVYIGGTGINATASNTYAFRSTAAATYDIRNNIFTNVRSNASTGGVHYAIVLSSASPAPNCNYNVYQYSGTGGSFASLDGATTPIATYTAASSWTTTDINSIAGTLSAVNLHINTAVASVANNAGTPVTAVTTDFDGDTRSATTPDIGADEFTSVLPVTLVNFWGQKQSGSNVLYWTTANEINNKGFELQRSIDGQSFTTLGFIASKAVNGNSASLLTYESIDAQPFAADNYYRLKQVDKNGSFSYSNIVLLKGTEPVITANTAGNTSLIIHDMNGRVVVTQTVSLTQGTNRMQLNAAPGDTTWVQAQNDIQLNYYNNFDASVSFPSGAVSYRKIIMVFTLGKYQCPSTEQYCGDWDYTIQNYLMTPAGDTLELARLITPYANASYPRTPFSWKQHYYFDVTEFYPLLKNNAAIRLLYSGYSGGFTANIKFAFIEGTPPRNVISIKKLWQGSYNYGNASSPIDNTITPVSVTAPAGTTNAEMKVLVTGHGSDNNGCSEFCSKYYTVKQNGSVIAQQQMWKADCGYNDLYPQSGTWMYNRANWCPGQQISGSRFKLNNIIAGTSYTADVDFQAYTLVGTGLMFHYGPMNNTLDASIEDILSPTTYEGDFRANPMCGSPVIRIMNTGSIIITNVYPSPRWMQLLLPLPALTPLGSMTASNTAVFTATIQQVNGVADTNYTDTKWVLQDLNGNTIAQRTPSSTSSTTDPIGPLPAGCYKITVTDAGCDGLYWWGNSSSTGIGAFYATDSSQTNIIPFTNGLPSDFGCGFTQYFRVGALLPLDLLSFYGKANTNNTNDLFWTTTQEQNVARFDIEYSPTGTQFTKVGQVTANGNTTTQSNYSFTHTPGTPAPVYYYRLRMVNADGSAMYSNTIQIIPSTTKFEINSVTPNPFDSQVVMSITSIVEEPVSRRCICTYPGYPDGERHTTKLLHK
ncbi:hypothetical protein F5148DRAFT_1150819 [Russula earlei]|uniref:Uncharacterized protein n=1 Tax=Russula earlei TaxID=71964 RepID=A0ACC0U4W1_9AGAM|nr:hypothetical protein F5148DRAFT_1150819 [Russula earlei]